MHRYFLSAAAIMGGLAVVLGAFGAHALKQHLGPDTLAVYETGVRYQIYHAFALALAGILYGSYPNRWIRRSGQLFLVGTFLFSGSLYLLTLGGDWQQWPVRWAGPVTPLGGLCLIAGWFCLIPGIRGKQESGKL
ncbi:MAG TPA: DUF423 domain-containing protein [Sediminibacterium sp.]|nr:DUF423 domain-containing protein [Sediminibacterium sp.]